MKKTNMDATRYWFTTSEVINILMNHAQDTDGAERVQLEVLGDQNTNNQSFSLMIVRNKKPFEQFKADPNLL